MHACSTSVMMTDGPLRRQRRRRSPARGLPPTLRPLRRVSRGSSWPGAARWRDGLLYCLNLRVDRRCAQRASDTGSARAACHSAGRALWPRQDAGPGAPLVVARPAGCCEGVRAHLPNVSARQGRPPAAGRPAVPPSRFNAPRWVHKSELPRAALRPLLP